MTDIQSELCRFRCECNTVLNAPCSCSGLEVECPICHKINLVPSESAIVHKLNIGSHPVLPLQNFAPVSKVRSLPLRVRNMIILACLLGLGAFFFAGFTVPFIILFHPIIIGSAFVSGKPPNPSEFYRLGGFLFSMDVAIAAGALGIFGGSLIGLGTSGGWGRRKNGIRTAIFTDRIVNDFQLLREVHVAVINESATPRRINPPLNVDLKIKFREKKVAGFEHRWQKIKQTHSIEISKDGLLIDPSQRREIILTVLSLKYNNEYVLSGRLGPYSLGKTNFWSS